jgi:hypothetical protein
MCKLMEYQVFLCVYMVRCQIHYEPSKLQDHTYVRVHIRKVVAIRDHDFRRKFKDPRFFNGIFSNEIGRVGTIL